MASTYLTRTMGSATSRYTFTLSMWVKRSKSGEEVFWNSYVSNAYRFQLFFNPSDNLVVYNVDNDVEIVKVETNRKFRDFNGWYHIYVAVKSSETTASDRIKIYVNGVQETSFSSATYQSTSNDMAIGTSSYALNIGRYGGNTAFFGGSMSHSYYVDGSIIDVTQFGSTDATTGEWKINTSPTIASYGNQGHLILKDGNTITDSSPNSNNFTLGGGTLTKTEDNPSNVFAILNSLPKSGVSFSYGNLQADNQSSDWTSALATFGSSTGKWYAEFKVTDDASGTTRNMFGVCDARDVQTMSEDELGQNTSGRVGDTVGYSGNGSGNCLKNGSDQGSGFNTTYTIGDIISVALDCDNGAVYIAKNGTYLNSGSPTSGASKTGAVTITTGETYLIGGTVYNSTYQANFGNGYFGTTAVSSAGTNASGIGIFEYDVPTGYTALSTKGLNL